MASAPSWRRRAGFARPTAAMACNFTAAAPARVWLADITYIPTAEGWIYLAAIILDASADAAIWLDTWSASRELNLLVLRGRNKWG